MKLSSCVKMFMKIDNNVITTLSWYVRNSYQSKIYAFISRNLLNDWNTDHQKRSAIFSSSEDLSFKTNPLILKSTGGIACYKKKSERTIFILDRITLAINISDTFFTRQWIFKSCKPKLKLPNFIFKELIIYLFIFGWFLHSLFWATESQALV